MPQRDLEAKIALLSNHDSDSSEDEDQGKKQERVAIKDNSFLGKLKKKGKESSTSTTDEASNIIYLGHIPPNFEEREIRSFFSQFGRILKVALSRSRQTTNLRGYGFVKFEDKEVASIAAETMSGYLMGNRRLVCHVIPKSKIHSNLFRKSDTIFKKIDFGKIHRNKVNKPKSMKKMQQITKILISREQKKRSKLKELGIDYDFPGYEASDKSHKIQVSDENADVADVKEDKSSKNEKSKKGKSSNSSKTEKKDKSNEVVKRKNTTFDDISKKGKKRAKKQSNENSDSIRTDASSSTDKRNDDDSTRREAGGSKSSKKKKGKKNEKEEKTTEENSTDANNKKRSRKKSFDKTESSIGEKRETSEQGESLPAQTPNKNAGNTKESKSSEKKKAKESKSADKKKGKERKASTNKEDLSVEKEEDGNKRARKMSIDESEQFPKKQKKKDDPKTPNKEKSSDAKETKSSEKKKKSSKKKRRKSA